MRRERDEGRPQRPSANEDWGSRAPDAGDTTERWNPSTGEPTPAAEPGGPGGKRVDVPGGTQRGQEQGFSDIRKQGGPGNLAPDPLPYPNYGGHDDDLGQMGGRSGVVGGAGASGYGAGPEDFVATSAPGGVPQGDLPPKGGGSGIRAGDTPDAGEITGRNLSGVGAHRLGKTTEHMYMGPERRRRQEERDYWFSNDRRRHTFTYGERRTI